MDIVKLADMYQNNEKFKDYVDKYKRTHGIPLIEDVFKCIMVQSYAEYLTKEEKHEH